MRFALFIAILLFCIVIGVIGAEIDTSAYEQPTNSIAACDVWAYVIDQDPKGLNVRSGPGSSFSIIGNLPKKDETGVGVHITGSNGDWVRIDTGVEEGSEDEQTFFKGVGWVYAPLLGLSGISQPEGGTPLYREASLKSRVIKLVPGDEGVNVRGCRGKWFYVEYEKVKGWAAPETLCNNPLTTCA